MLDLEGLSLTADAPPVMGEADAVLASLAPAPAPTRGITPRRPLRLSPSREDNAADPRQSLAALNIFADIFDPDPVASDPSARDPRVAASRLRARRMLDTSLNTLAPDEANFWHPSVPDILPPELLAPVSATIPANDLPDLPAPLHEQLSRVRDALYAAHLDEDARTLDGSSLQIRLASHALTATLVVVAFPVGAALTTYSVLRGANIRLSTQAMAVVAGVLGVVQAGLPSLL